MVVWVMRDLVFSLVVFVIPEPLTRCLASRGIKSLGGVQVQASGDLQPFFSNRVLVFFGEFFWGCLKGV